MHRVLLKINPPEVSVCAISDEYLQECNGKAVTADKEKTKFNAYLKKGIAVSILLDLTKCMFCGKSIEHFLTLCTDGEWVWSADLHHYSEEHHFVWPQAFVESIAAKHYKRSKLSKGQLDVVSVLLQDIQQKFMTAHPFSWMVDRPFPQLPKIKTYHVDEL